MEELQFKRLDAREIVKKIAIIIVNTLDEYYLMTTEDLIRELNSDKRIKDLIKTIDKAINQ